MTTVSEVLRFLNTIAPPDKAMDWDNNGLLCGSKSKAVQTILVALDPFEDVAREAAAMGADLLVTHHPLIFRPIRAVNDVTGVGRTIQALIRHDISAINLHTNLDVAPEGVNHVLAQTLGMQNVCILNPTEPGWGLLRGGEVEEQSLEQFLEHVKNTLHTPVLRYADGGRPVHRVACGGGACADEI